MFASKIDINENYFYMPFGPNILNPKSIGLSPVLFSNIYVNVIQNSKWRKCKLYNTGWGRPDGFERIPELQFDDLIKLALQSDYKTTKLSVHEEESNKYGSVAIIMDRHIDKLIEFLSIHINNELLYSNLLYRNNLKLFCFDSQYSPNTGGNDIFTYEEILRQYPKWNNIEQKVKSQIYID